MSQSLANVTTAGKKTHLSLQIQLLHLLLTVANSNEGTWLGLLLRAAFLLHVVQLLLPAAAQQIHTGRRTKKPKRENREELKKGPCGIWVPHLVSFCFSFKMHI